MTCPSAAVSPDGRVRLRGDRIAVRDVRVPAGPAAFGLAPLVGAAPSAESGAGREQHET